MTPRLDVTKARLQVKVFIIGSKETRLDNSANEKFQKLAKAIETLALSEPKADAIGLVANGFLKYYNSYPAETRSKVSVKIDVERVTLGKKTPVAWYQDFILTTSLDYLASVATAGSQVKQVMDKFNAIQNPTQKLVRSQLDDKPVHSTVSVSETVEYTPEDFNF